MVAAAAPPRIRYAKSGDVHIAYQVAGDGPVDLVFAPGSVSNLDVYWENPDLAQWFREVAAFTRLIVFDKRGTGLSDRTLGSPTLDERTDDIRAVMDAAGSERAVLFGLSEGATMSALFAATYPNRTTGLVLFGGYPRGGFSPDYPWGRTRESLDEVLAQIESDWDGYVDGFASNLAPSRGDDPAFRAWVARLVRYGGTPASEIARRKLNWQIDIRPILASIRAPTLVLHPADDRMVPSKSGRALAQGIAGSRYAEYPSADHAFWVGRGSREYVAGEVRRFVEGLRGPEDTDRVLTTVMFTDLVGSTATASSLGDRRWGELLGAHLAASRETISRFRGQQVKNLGDGVLVTFDGPTRAVRCACELRDRVGQLGLQLRVGLHTGEVVVRDRDVEGIAVHLASRLVERAKGGEILVSGTVRDLAVGSGLQFSTRGVRSLRGVAGKWRIFAAEPLPSDSVPVPDPTPARPAGPPARGGRGAAGRRAPTRARAAPRPGRH